MALRSHPSWRSGDQAHNVKSVDPFLDFVSAWSQAHYGRARPGVVSLSPTPQAHKAVTPHPPPPPPPNCARKKGVKGGDVPVPRVDVAVDPDNLARL